jgi:hypothetical protein
LKNGLFSVFSTSATLGAPPAVLAGDRLQAARETMNAKAAKAATTRILMMASYPIPP